MKREDTTLKKLRIEKKTVKALRSTTGIKAGDSKTKPVSQVAS
jgi:hypothetical protein